MGKAASKLSKEDIKKLQEHTYFDKRELQSWYKGFLRDCPSGQLTEEDFAKIYQQFFPFGDPKEYCHYLFLQFDQDNSNFIDFREFILAFSITSRGSTEQKIAWAFDFYDYNKTGKLTYNDILPVISAAYKMIGPMAALPPDESTPELRAEKWFTLLDKNKDTDMIKLDDFKRLANIDPSIKSALTGYSDLV
ncbi:Frq1 protein [Candida orthopsilosis Co 90-125]|uniref:Calcium-binding protein NCS-1 n=1 Tax=Candida orthopsilosis (strain 90-125) TaxID=1136231 RepID=H8WWG3_CANO9|nr:Frq1 protein [Candida orthopsilosis Co 90-125]CCG20787.1 Frq1 protein [Candida orthopsilosis Co 90-125]